MVNTRQVMTHTELCHTLDISMSELEPFLLETVDNHYPCSVEGLYHWVSDISTSRTQLEKSNVSWLLLMLLETDTDTNHLMSDDTKSTIKDYIETELTKIESSLKN